MRSSYQRHIGYLLKQEKKFNLSIAEGEGKAKPVIPPEFNAKDWLTYLLHIDAQLEHSLMVQYLYSAYSLGGENIAKEKQEIVKGWQEIIIGIAKEEMGHLVSIQNVLRVIGAPLNFDRQDFPWNSVLYPFEFSLEPLTKYSLAKYIYAESPTNWLDDDTGDDEMREIKKEIRELLSADTLGDPVSALFNTVIAMLEDDELIPDDIFLPETYPYQAKFDEWGRGYAGGARGNNTNSNPSGAPDVLVTPLVARTDTINTVKQIAEQGESPTDEGDKRSHFQRFLNIYKVWRKLPPDFNPSRNLANNPTIPSETNENSADKGENEVWQNSYITDELSKLWGNLFNVRYRMLLTYLTHSFLIGDGFNNSVNSPRGAIIHATFGEMYNLRSIANILVRLPMGEGSDKFAGPPFLIPYTLELPIGETNRWRLHLDLLEASSNLINDLFDMAKPEYENYLYSLKETDSRIRQMAMKIAGTTIV